MTGEERTHSTAGESAVLPLPGTVADSCLAGDRTAAPDSLIVVLDQGPEAVVDAAPAGEDVHRASLPADTPVGAREEPVAEHERPRYVAGLVRGMAGVVVVALAVAGCTQSAGAPPEATVPTAPPTSPTTAPVDVSVIPEVIDERYLTAVLAALDEVDGEATRMIVAAKNVTPAAADYLNAIYSDEETTRQVDLWYLSIGDDPELEGIRPSPGNRVSSIERVITASPTCVWLAVKRDYSTVNFDPGPDEIEYMALQPLDRSNDPRGVNPTAWMITHDVLLEDRTEPEDPCRPS